MCPSPTPTYPKPRGCKSATTDRAHRVGSSSGPTTTVVMTLLSLFSWRQKRFHPFDPDTMTNTTLEAASSSCSKNISTRTFWHRSPQGKFTTEKHKPEVFVSDWVLLRVCVRDRPFYVGIPPRYFPDSSFCEKDQPWVLAFDELAAADSLSDAAGVGADCWPANWIVMR